jgi:hypothetical protein
LAVLATLAATRTSHLLGHGVSSHVALTSGYRLGFVVGAMLVVAAFVVALTVLRPAAAGAGVNVKDTIEGEDGRVSGLVQGA